MMVDDAHASGVFGKNGRGTIDHFGMHGRVDIQVGTLSKAIGALGGYVAGNAQPDRVPVSPRAAVPVLDLASAGGRRRLHRGARRPDGGAGNHRTAVGQHSLLQERPRAARVQHRPAARARLRRSSPATAPGRWRCPTGCSRKACSPRASRSRPWPRTRRACARSSPPRTRARTCSSRSTRSGESDRSWDSSKTIGRGLAVRVRGLSPALQRTVVSSNRPVGRSSRGGPTRAAGVGPARNQIMPCRTPIAIRPLEPRSRGDEAAQLRRTDMKSSGTDRARQWFDTYTRDLSPEDIAAPVHPRHPRRLPVLQPRAGRRTVSRLPWWKRVAVRARQVFVAFTLKLPPARRALYLGALLIALLGVFKLFRGFAMIDVPFGTPFFQISLLRAGLGRRHLRARHQPADGQPAGAARGGGPAVAQGRARGRARDPAGDAAERDLRGRGHRDLRRDAAGEHRRRRFLRRAAARPTAG